MRTFGEIPLENVYILLNNKKGEKNRRENLDMYKGFTCNKLHPH